MKSKKNQKITPNMQLKNTTLQLLWDAKKRSSKMAFIAIQIFIKKKNKTEQKTLK